MAERLKGGLPVGLDGRVHTTIGHNPSTLRFSSSNPNMQNIPREEGEASRWVKGMFVAPPGWAFWKRDYAGIEALLVGYLAASQRYYHLCQLDVHSFVTAYVLELEGTLTKADLPDIAWSDADLSACLAGIKGRFKARRNVVKRGVHGWNYRATSLKIQEVLLNELETLVPLKEVERIRSLYFELFPEITVWHERLVLTSYRNPAVRAESGFVARFYNTVEWDKVPTGMKEDGTVACDWKWSFGKEAKELIGFKPQHLAACILKRAMVAIWQEARDVGESLRLPIHDELLGEVPSAKIEECLAVSGEIMERPVPYLPLDPAWGLGDCVRVRTEATVGSCWADMKEVT